MFHLGAFLTGDDANPAIAEDVKPPVAQAMAHASKVLSSLDVRGSRRAEQLAQT
jgi:hypothetical protein